LDDISTRLGSIAIIGGGKMGEAIVSGLVHGAMFDPGAVTVAEPNAEQRDRLSAKYAISCVASPTEVSQADTVILAVKPQMLRQASEQLLAAPGFAPQRLVSIAAGVTTGTLSSLFEGCAVIRVMPNAPLMVGAGISAVCIADGTSRSEGELACELFSCMGEAVLLDEGLMNAATAISGSGPAYFALFVECLAKAGEEIGLEPKAAMRLAAQTLQGSARYLELTESSASELRIAVTSPGGTTQAALEEFAAQGLEQAVAAAVKAALHRAGELA
jgi:pyrroline-5-carboxylate reductase